jgi:hypothetical protein
MKIGLGGDDRRADDAVVGHERRSRLVARRLDSEDEAHARS